MKSHRENFRQHLSLFLTISFFGFTATSLADESDLTKQVLNCAKLTNAEQKLACFDLIANGLMSHGDSTSIETASEGQTQASDPAIKEEGEDESEAIPEMDDAMGGGQFADKAGVKEKLTRGRITSCKKSADRRWFFFFENGQIWKQVDTRKRRFRDCDFDVVIAEDAFGYMMRLDDSKTKIRINRIR